MTRNDPSVRYFLRQIKYDRDYAVKMINEDNFWSNAVDLAYDKRTILYSIFDSDSSVYREFIEFIEGNGYKITRKEDPLFKGMMRCDIIAE